jgi:hypothetical protein
MWDYEKNNKKKIFPDKLNPESSDIAYFICQSHTSCSLHKFKARIRGTICESYGCTWCSHKSGHICSCDAFPNKWPELYKDFDHGNNEMDPYTLSEGSAVYINWKGYNCNHTWNARLSSRTKQGNGCPVCKNSKLELKLKEILEKLKDKYNISFKPQKTFNECRNPKTNRILPFDEGVKGFKKEAVIEGDGIQHFEDLHFDGKTSDLGNTQFRDKIKTLYCFKNNIHLLRISYSEIDNIEKHIREFFEMIKEYEADEECQIPVLMLKGKEYLEDTYRILF